LKCDLPVSSLCFFEWVNLCRYVEVNFTTNKTYCDVKVDSVSRTTDGGPVKFFGASTITCESYQVV
jgi:hypothetical protein